MRLRSSYTAFVYQPICLLCDYGFASSIIYIAYAVLMAKLYDGIQS